MGVNDEEIISPRHSPGAIWLSAAPARELSSLPVEDARAALSAIRKFA